MSLDPVSRGPHASKTMSFLAMDDPDHLRLRTLVSKGFTPRRIRELEPRVTEIALLHLLNAAAEAGQKLLIAGRAPPARWPVRLPDLASRLRAMTAIRIDPPEDDLRAALLARLLSDRQLAVLAPVQRYLLTRLPRSHAALADAARRLDIAGLARGGPITYQVAEQVIADMAAEAGETAPEDGPFA